MNSSLRVAVIGAGPAGIYASNILRQNEPSASIDLYESLPSPYGLIRYGVAPDHPRIKGIVNSLHEMLAGDGIRLIGNVHIGRDLSVDDLRGLYHAVIFATGADKDALFALPGLDLSGSYGAADFVSWYDGHPDVPRDWPLDATDVAVLGNGNVALDVARVLAKHPIDMLSTDVPENVYRHLEGSPVTDVHVFGRRGPADIKFTPIELRELGEIAGVDIVLEERDFAYPVDESELRTNQQKIMARTLDSWRGLPSTGASRRLHLHFYHEPLALVGDGRVEAIRFARTEPVAGGGVRRTGEELEYAVQSVYRAIGYRGAPVDGVPFDEAGGVIRNVGGRVVDSSGTQMPGIYATGWIKRGPVGLIGHTKSDAQETIANLLSDAAEFAAPASPAMEAPFELLEARGVQYTTWEGWLTLDAHERALGEADTSPVERERVKVVPRDEQVEISRGGVSAPVA